MNQYLVTAYDFKNDGALQHRMSVRPNHLEGAKALKENGNLITAGAMLSAEGKMIGSTMILQFESDEAMEAWKKQEPYFTEEVWETIDIKPFKVAQI